MIGVRYSHIPIIHDKIKRFGCGLILGNKRFNRKNTILITVRAKAVAMQQSPTTGLLREFVSVSFVCSYPLSCFTARNHRHPFPWLPLLLTLMAIHVHRLQNRVHAKQHKIEHPQCAHSCLFLQGCLIPCLHDTTAECCCIAYKANFTEFSTRRAKHFIR